MELLRADSFRRSFTLRGQLVMKQEERLPIQQNRAAKTTKPCIPPENMETLYSDETGGEATNLAEQGSQNNQALHPS
jgi:hypothetical protein